MAELICIVCPKGCKININEDCSDISGHGCQRGYDYAKSEFLSPKRIVTSTVKVKGAVYRRLPVKTDKEVDKNLIIECVKLLNEVELNCPVEYGDIIVENILNTGINFIATRSMH